MPGATYFVTCCTGNRTTVFNNAIHAAAALTALRMVHDDDGAAILAATIMPDHVHILFTLGARLRLGQVVAKFKSLAHNHGLAPWRWQEESFEHRLRPVESIEDYAFYIFMNPYCAGLTMPTQRWPWWFCPAGEQFRFLSLIQREAGIPPEWIKDAQAISKRLALRRPAEWK